MGGILHELFIFVQFYESTSSSLLLLKATHSLKETEKAIYEVSCTNKIIA